MTETNVTLNLKLGFCYKEYRRTRSLTVFGDVDDGTLPPAEEEVADRQAQHQGQAQPHVVRHEHQHQHVGSGRLQDVQQGLDEVAARQHRISRTETRASSGTGHYVECNTENVLYWGVENVLKH